MTVDRRTAEQDAVGYWRQFTTAFYFDKPKDEISGHLIDHQTDGPARDLIPKLLIQTKDGKRRVVLATQERLKVALQDAGPVRGDWICIRYTGDAPRAAPGMTPSKLFTVDVRRPGSQTPARPETIRGSATENDPGSGDTSA